MYSIRIFLVIITMLLVCSACATSKTYIKIKQPDVVMEYGKAKFKVLPNDILEVIEVRPCRNLPGICYGVVKKETGETGIVIEERMMRYHEVYTVDKKKVTVIN